MITSFPALKYKGEENDNYHANAYALKCMFVGYAVLIFSWLLYIFNIFIVDLQIMNIAVGGAGLLCLAALGYAVLAGIDKKSSCYVIMLHFVLMATVICTELAYHTTIFMIFPLICSAQYFDKKISLFTAVTTCAGCAVSVLIGYRIGLCDANMLLLTYTGSAYHIKTLLENTFAVNQDTSLMFLFFVFPRWLIILSLMPLLNHIARDIQKRAERETTARRLAETDGLTGLCNRTKYLQNLVNHYPAAEHVAVLYFDINNLKTVNDTMGHEYGDILICGLANAMHDRENEGIKCFRLGGDEFVMILEGDAASGGESILADAEKNINGKELEEGLRLSVAIGYAAGKGRNLENVVKAADENMYKKKQQMKLSAE